MKLNQMDSFLSDNKEFRFHNNKQVTTLLYQEY